MGVSTHMHTPPKSKKKAIQLKKDIKERILIYSNTIIVVLVRNSEKEKRDVKKRTMLNTKSSSTYHLFKSATQLARTSLGKFGLCRDDETLHNLTFVIADVTYPSRK